MLAALLLTPALLLPTASVQVPAPAALCTPRDVRLTELSAPGVRGGSVLASGDGDVTQVLELDPSTCAVTGTLDVGGPTAFARVGQVRITATDTTGGPVGAPGSVLVTGGAVSADGTVVALRTYTDAYVWAAPDRDVVAAMARAPVRVPLAAEPQGEAVAFTADGALLSGSAAPDGSLPAVRTVTGAVQLVAAVTQAPETTPPPTTDQQPAGTPGTGLARWQAAVIAVVVAAAVVWLVGKLRRMGRSR